MIVLRQRDLTLASECEFTLTLRPGRRRGAWLAQQAARGTRQGVDGVALAATVVVVDPVALIVAIEQASPDEL